MRGGAHLSRFPEVHALGEDNKPATWRIARCEACGYDSRVRQNTRKKLPDEMLAKSFLARGWALSPRQICPRCREGKKPMSPAARRAAFCRMAGVARAADPETLTEIAAMPPAETPRPPTPEEKRRIREALDAHYDEGAGRYHKAFSDKSVAATLNLPPRWVADLREAMGLGPDACAADAERAAAAAELEKRITALEARVEEALTVLASEIAELRSALNRLKIDRSYAA